MTPSVCFAETRRELAARLLKILSDAGDPRVTGDEQTYDRPPFTDVEPVGPRKKDGGKAVRKQGE